MRLVDRLKFLEFKFMTEIQINSIKIFEKNLNLKSI